MMKWSAGDRARDKILNTWYLFWMENEMLTIYMLSWN